MRALKVLIVVMGVLILAAIATIAYTLVAGTAKLDATGPWTNKLPVPEGSAIKGQRTDGERLIVHVSRPGKGDALYILDLRDGSLLGTVTLKND